MRRRDREEHSSGRESHREAAYTVDPVCLCDCGVPLCVCQGELGRLTKTVGQQRRLVKALQVLHGKAKEEEPTGDADADADADNAGDEAVVSKGSSD